MSEGVVNPNYQFPPRSPIEGSASQDAVTSSRSKKHKSKPRTHETPRHLQIRKRTHKSSPFLSTSHSRRSTKKPSVDTAEAQSKLYEASKNAAKLSETSISLIIDFTNSLIENEFARVEIARKNFENEITMAKRNIGIQLENLKELLLANSEQDVAAAAQSLVQVTPHVPPAPSSSSSSEPKPFPGVPLHVANSAGAKAAAPAPTPSLDREILSLLSQREVDLVRLISSREQELIRMLTLREQELLYLLANTDGSSPSALSAVSSQANPLHSSSPSSSAVSPSSLGSTASTPNMLNPQQQQQQQPKRSFLRNNSSKFAKKKSDTPKPPGASDALSSSTMAAPSPAQLRNRRPSAGEALSSIANRLGFGKGQPSAHLHRDASVEEDPFLFSKDFKVFLHDLDHWLCCLSFDDNYLVTGCLNSREIKVWDMHTREARVLAGHENIIYCLQFHGDKLISGSGDGFFNVWSLSSGKCLLSVAAHPPNGVLCLQFDHEIIVTGCTDREIAVWDVNTGALQRKLVGHDDAVWCLRFDATRIISGSEDTTIIVWNRADGAVINTLTGHKSPVRCLQFAGNSLVSGADDGAIKIWNITAAACLHTLEAHDGSVIALQIVEKRFISGSFDLTLRVWDLDTGRQLQTLTGHSLGVYCLQYRNGKLLSGSEDGMILEWHHK